MTSQELKNAILLLALQGKLVEQRKEEGTAEELYQQSIREKNKLVKAGILKKEKPLQEIVIDETPFEIPESWKWCYVGDLFMHNTGKALNGSDRSGQLMTYITTSNLYWNRFELNTLKEMPFTETEVEKCTVTKGDLLVCEGGDFGRSAIWSFDFPMRIQNHIHRLRPYVSIIIQYAYYLFYLYKNAGMLSGKGIAIQGLSSNALHALKFPLAPLNEQKRIVAKIEELMPLIEEYGKAEEQLTALNTGFPDKLRKSILQQAIQGKLTERDPADEPAAELLKRIRAEKEKLIKEGKIKKEKPLPPITEDEIPFEIPDTWSYTRLSELAIGQITYGIIKLGEEDESGVKVLRCSDVKPGWINPTGIRTVKKQLSDEYSRTILQGGEIVINVRGTLGGCAIVPNEYAGYNVAREVAVLPLTNQIDTTFILYVLLSPTFDLYLSNNLRGVAYKGLNIELLSSFSLPIPPLGEQKRIVERVNELLTITDEMKGCYE